MNKKLKNLISELKQIELIEIHYNDLILLKSEYEIRFNEIKTELIKKNTRIEALSKVTFKSLYLRAVGSLNLKLELHEKHYLNLSLEFNDLSKSLDLIDYEISVLKTKLNNLAKKKKEFRVGLKLLKRKGNNLNSKNLKK